MRYTNRHFTYFTYLLTSIDILTGAPWTNYIKGPIPYFEFTEEVIIIKVLTKITIKHKTMMKCEVKSNFIVCPVNYCNFNYCK